MGSLSDRFAHALVILHPVAVVALAPVIQQPAVAALALVIQHPVAVAVLALPILHPVPSVESAHVFLTAFGLHFRASLRSYEKPRCDELN